MECFVVSGFDFGKGKVFVFGFGFLQVDYIGLFGGQLVEQMWQVDFEGIDVLGGDFYGVILGG